MVFRYLVHSLVRLLSLSSFLLSYLAQALLVGFLMQISITTYADEAELKKALQTLEDLKSNCPKCFDFFTTGVFETLAPDSYLTAEDPKSCTPLRDYFFQSIENFRSYDPTGNYLKTRPKNPIGERRLQPKQRPFARECVTFAMRTFLKEKNPSVETDSYANCPNGNTLPRQGTTKPCVTDEYINLVTNSFEDVTECLQINPKVIIPKLMNESGFHINAFNALKINDVQTNKSRYLFDLRVCNHREDKITSFDQLKACSAEQIQNFFAGEEKIMEENKILDTDTDEIKKKKKENISEWRKKNSVMLREVFDFKKASDDFYNNLLDKIQNKTSCSKHFIEKFCQNDTRIIGGDAGINQFTNDAVEESKVNLGRVKEIISNRSNVPACQRLNEFIKKDPTLLQENDARLSKRCRYLSTPPNPVMSLLGYASFYFAQKDNVVAGLKKINKNASEETKEAITLLAYNTGPGAALTYYKKWLKYKNEQSKPLGFIDYMSQVNNQKYLTYVEYNANLLNQVVGVNQCAPENYLKNIQ